MNKCNSHILIYVFLGLYLQSIFTLKTKYVVGNGFYICAKKDTFIQWTSNANLTLDIIK